MTELREEGTIEHHDLQRITKRAHLLQDPPQFVSFIVEGETILVHKTLLVNCQSPFFNPLLSGRFTESADKPITLEEISCGHFRVFKKWVENSQAGDHFDEMEVEDILDFIEEVHRFDIPQLITDCERKFEEKLEKLNAISITELVPLFNRVVSLKELEAFHNLSFSIIAKAFIANLEDIGLYFTPAKDSLFFHQEDQSKSNLFPPKKENFWNPCLQPL